MKTELDPSVISNLISDISTIVTANNELSLTFSGLVSAGAGNISINNSDDGNVFLQINVNLNFDTIDDFDAADTTAPTLTSSIPADDTGAVLVDTNLVLTFDEAVVAGAGNIVISDGNDSRIIPVNDDQVSIIGNIVTINPTLDLNTDTTYNVQLASGVINDVAGNAYAGINDAATFNFATTDTIAPLAPTLALAADTGSDPNDHITSDSTVNVSGLEGGATWEYSADRGDNWIAGNAGNSFELRTGIYSTGQVLVRQIDVVGNVSNTGTFADTVVIEENVTITDARYNVDSNTLTFTGTNLDSLLDTTETSTSDIKTKLDLSKLQWDVNSDDTGNLSFAQSTIDSATVTTSETLEIVFSNTRATQLEQTVGFDPLVVDDSVEVTDGFLGEVPGIALPVGGFDGPESITDTSVVVFDLVSGVSSHHSNRSFDATTSYTIYIRVDSDSGTVRTDENAGPGTFGRWASAENLGRDDKVVLVGNDPQADVGGELGEGNGNVSELVISTRSASRALAIVWVDERAGGLLQLTSRGEVARFSQPSALSPGPDLWTGIGLPSFQASILTAYQRTMADSILVTQGLL